MALFKKTLILFVFAVLAVAFIDLFIKSSENKCQMTYMYQLPQYIEIKLGSIQRYFKTYRLFVYGEGQYAESLSMKKFNGNPVLFVPGNAGSFEQVRSLASVALLMSYTRMNHLNYFTIDFNEDLTAFDGDKLELQSKFLFYSVKKIIDIYQHVPNIRIVLIGHSIGGNIIESMLTMPYVKPYLSHIAVVFTLATPHKYPGNHIASVMQNLTPLKPTAIGFDFKTIQFHKRIREDFNSIRQNDFENINFVSIGGSHRDNIVRSDLIALNSSYKYDRVHLTTAIDDVWASADHLCIVWCRQLMVKLNRLIFNLIHSDQNVFMELPSARQEIIDYHLSKRRYRNERPSFETSTSVFYTNDHWIDQINRLVRLNITKVFQTTNHLFVLYDRESIFVNIEGSYQPTMISACKASTNSGNISCSDPGFNLHDRMRLAPSETKIDRHFGHFDSSELRQLGYTHLVVRLRPSQSSYSILVDRYTTYVRTKETTLPTYLEFGLWNPQPVFTKLISQEQAFFNLSLKNFVNIWDSYSVSIQAKSCYRSSSSFVGFAHLSLPNADLNEYIWPMNPIKGSQYHFRLQLNEAIPANSTPSLQLYLEPNCGFEVSVKFSYIYAHAQLLRHYFMLLFPIAISIGILLLAYQFGNIPFRFSFTSTDLEKFKTLCKVNFGDVDQSNPRCCLFLSPTEMMINSRYFIYTMAHSVLSSMAAVYFTKRFYPHYDLLSLSHLPPATVASVCLILFLFAYSTVYIFTFVIITLVNSFAKLINLIIERMLFNWQASKHRVEFKGNTLYLSFLLAIFLLSSLFLVQLNFYLVYLLFTLLFLVRSVRLNYLESQIGRTTSTSLIASTYPLIFTFYLVVTLLHIPQTIDQYRALLRAKLTFDFTKQMLYSHFKEYLQSSVLIAVYLFLYFSPLKLEARLDSIGHPMFRMFLNFILISLASLNIVLGVICWEYINYLVLATAVVFTGHVMAVFQQKPSLKVD